MGKFVTTTAPTMTRPANTTQYTAGDLVANNATVGSVVPLAFSRNRLQGRNSGRILGGAMRKSAATVTVATFRLHLFSAAPTPATNGDNGAILVSSLANYLGFMDFDFTTTGNNGNIIGGAILKRNTALAAPLHFSLTGSGGLFGLIEATGAYAPASGETFDVALDVEV
jgi:hypothetical protein